MARKVMSQMLVALVAFMGLCHLQERAFVPPVNMAVRPAVPSAIAAAVASGFLAAAPALAGDNVPPRVDTAAKKFANLAHPLLEKIDWVKMPVFTKWYGEEAEWTPEKLAIAERKILQAGMAMDPALVQKAVRAHHYALNHVIEGDNIIAPVADMEEISVSLAQMIASAGAERIRAIYDAFYAIDGGEFNSQAMESIGGAGEVGATYKAFIDLVEVMGPLAKP